MLYLVSVASVMTYGKKVFVNAETTEEAKEKAEALTIKRLTARGFTGDLTKFYHIESANWTTEARKQKYREALEKDIETLKRELEDL